MATPEEPVYALIATKNRWRLLSDLSLPSVKRQTRPPDLVVVVNDGHDFSHVQHHVLSEMMGTIPTVILRNGRIPGVAGAWNTGLTHIKSLGLGGFVAVLDDDDSWDDCHLAENEAAAQVHDAQIVVAGLRLVIDGVDNHRPLIRAFADREFLIGNPGWQGSNTFVRTSLLLQVGGFRDGLQSLNDRDLAIRLLRASRSPPALVARWTSSWHVRTNSPSLSTPNCPAKLSGLRWFWRIYGSQMTPPEAEAFFDRAADLFSIPRVKITEATPDVPAQFGPQGGLLAN